MTRRLRVVRSEVGDEAMIAGHTGIVGTLKDPGSLTRGILETMLSKFGVDRMVSETERVLAGP